MKGFKGKTEIYNELQDLRVFLNITAKNLNVLDMIFLLKSIYVYGVFFEEACMWCKGRPSQV